ncbi:MAG: 3'(2'),5'-bisphosphate nucleotidase [Epsilonproteobacteria bacterium]|nr:MAG: 3'(2'),5'-bisphosphate nucleotidase [Campylobacterota bacterium]
MPEKIDLEVIKEIAKNAGDAVMKIYEQDFSVKYKADASPLTQADLESNAIICAALTKYYPEIPILSEENKAAAYEDRQKWDYFWLIDPIDGTKEFVKKNGEFTINIALVHHGRPILGVVYAPVLEDMYAASRGEGAFKNGQRLPLKINNDPKKKLRVVASKSHLSQETQDFIDALETEIIEQISKGSSLKLCLVAEGEADIYPRMGPTMEWDTAAAHAVVLESGKSVVQFESGEEVIYNKENLLNPWFIVKS